MRELPATPTFRELGYDVVVDAHFGIGAPAKLPEPIRAKIESAALKTARDPGFQNYINGTLGIEPAPLTGEQYRATIEGAQEAMSKYKGRINPPAN
jgi:tripartite-type tricarboxylate transporter receptor subunit TctC